MSLELFTDTDELLDLGSHRWIHDFEGSTRCHSRRLGISLVEDRVSLCHSDERAWTVEAVRAYLGETPGGNGAVVAGGG